MHKPSVIGVFVLTNSLLFSAASYAQESESNTEQVVSAEESAGEASAGASANHCDTAPWFEVGDEDGMLNAEVTFAAENFLSAVLISDSNQSFTHGEQEILLGSLASLGVGIDSSYSADIDLNGYRGPLWMQVLVLTEDGRILASEIRQLDRPEPAADAAASGDESGVEDN